MSTNEPRVKKPKPKDCFCNLICPISTQFYPYLKEECRRLWGPIIAYENGIINYN